MRRHLQELQHRAEVSKVIIRDNSIDDEGDTSSMRRKEPNRSKHCLIYITCRMPAIWCEISELCNLAYRCLTLHTLSSLTMTAPVTPKSILRMPNIECFPDIELLWLMNLFAHADGRSTCKLYAARVDSRNRAYLNSIYWRQDEVVRGHFEHCWFDNLIAFREAQAKYGRILRNTYYMVNLNVVHRETVDKENMLTVVPDGFWTDQDFMLRRLVNVVFAVDCTADVRAWTAIQNAIEKQTAALPSLRLLAVQVFRGACSSDDSEEMARFLAFSLRGLAKARCIVVEVHYLVRPVASVEALLL